jgi:hypothetical protein
MNRYVVALALSFLLRVFYDLTVGVSVEHLYLEAFRRVSGIFYIVMG